MVALDDWKAGGELKCQVTKRAFVLPSDLEEWLVDGMWVPGVPGRIRSPFRSSPEVEVPAEQWISGGMVTCPASGRRFRIPKCEPFPSLDLEKAAVQFAFANLEATQEVAAEALILKYPEATATQIGAIWERHQLTTLEQRQASEQTAEALPDAPGYVRSPYGARPRVEVPPALWVQSGSAMVCPTTGRRFRLPADLPPLEAQLVASDPGMVISPFFPERPFQLSPAQWKPGELIQCPETKQPLKMPAHLPEWKPVANVKEGHPGLAFSPFGHKRAMNVRAAHWGPGGIVTCAETGYQFVLPDRLPPMTGTVVGGAPGRALSPYAAAAEVQVPRPHWKAGTQLICPKTGRTFLLPEGLPAWANSPPLWQGAAIAAGVLLLAGIGFFARHFMSRAAHTTAGTAEAAAVSEPSDEHGHGPLATFTGGVQISDWKQMGVPASLHWSCETSGEKSGGRPKIEPVASDTFKLSFGLPDDLRGKKSVPWNSRFRAGSRCGARCGVIAMEALAFPSGKS